jgi:hypothetical protein
MGNIERSAAEGGGVKVLLIIVTIYLIAVAIYELAEIITLIKEHVDARKK